MTLRYTLFFIFTLSGFSGLIYESIWTHYLKLYLGHAAYAQTLVLAIFLGGLAVGSAISARYTMRWSGLIKRYALIEGLIGIIALLFHPTFIWTTELTFNQLLPAFADSPGVIYTIKYTLAALLILPQSVLLGMTFPLMVGGVIRLFPQNTAKTVSVLYFANSFGAVIGVLVSSFVLIDMVGLPGTVLTAGILNIVLALAVWVAVKGIESDKAEPYTPDESTATSASKQSRTIAGLLLIASLTGFSSFFYEIGWIRMLTLVMGSSTHSFEIMLAVFILGLATGSLWLSRRKQPLQRPWFMLAAAQLVMGASALLSIWIYISSYDLMQWFLQSINHTDATYSLYLIFCGLIACLIMLPATFCAGMTLPLATHLMMKTPMGEKGVGAVYTVNTTGAIIAIILATHAFMPLIGLKGLIISGAVIDILIGMVIVWYIMAGDVKRSKQVFAMTALLASFAVVVLSASDWDLKRLTSGVFRLGAIDSQGEILFYEDGKTSSVSIKQVSDDKIRTLTNNGKPDASIAMAEGAKRARDEATQFMLGALPLLHKPDTKNAAVIGLGSGVTPSTLLLSEDIERVDSIEIEQAVVTASSFFRPNVDAVYDDPRSRIHVDDAKTFFSVQQRKYDVIVSEPPNPWVSGVSTLFSEEFYARIKSYLAEDGLLIQWMHLYEISPQLVATVMNGIGAEFRDYKIYAVNNSNMIIVASANSMLKPLSAEAFSHIELNKELVTYGIHSLTDLQIRQVGDKRYLQSLFKHLNTAVNSDYFPILDTHSAKTRFTHDIANKIIELNKGNPFPLLRLLNHRAIDATAVTYNHDQIKSREYYRAVNLTKYLLSDSAVGSFGNEDGLDKSRWITVNYLKHLLSGCSNVNVYELNNQIHLVMAYTMPYVSKQKLSQILNRLDQSACTQQVPVKSWLTLYHSILDADWTQVYSTTSQLLALPQYISLPRREYLITALLYSSIYIEKTNIKTEWDKYAHLINEPGYLLRILLANSNAG